jgi:hypothetical protein
MNFRSINLEINYSHPSNCSKSLSIEYLYWNDDERYAKLWLRLKHWMQNTSQTSIQYLWLVLVLLSFLYKEEKQVSISILLQPQTGYHTCWTIEVCRTTRYYEWHMVVSLVLGASRSQCQSVTLSMSLLMFLTQYRSHHSLPWIFLQRIPFLHCFPIIQLIRLFYVIFSGN